MFAERASEAGQDPNSFVLRRGMELHDTDRVVVVEDVCTTGGSAKKVGGIGACPGSQVHCGRFHRRSQRQHDRFRVAVFQIDHAQARHLQGRRLPDVQQGTKAIKPGSSKK